MSKHNHAIRSRPSTASIAQAALEQRFLTEYFERYRRAIFNKAVIGRLIELKRLMKETQAGGKKAIIAGNGGSAAIAAHCAVDFTKNAGIRCINFNESSLITCLANDYGYECWLEKALEHYADSEDLIVLISASGKSANMLRASEYARRNGHPLVTFTGFSVDNPLKKLGHLNFWVNSRAYNVIEMTHHIWLLAVCDLIIGKAEYPVS